MKTQTSKHSHRQMFIIRNESQAYTRKNQYYYSSPQPPIQFIIHGQSLAPSKFKTFTKPSPKEQKIKQALQTIKHKLQTLKLEQTNFKNQVLQQSQSFKLRMQQIKSSQEININSIQSYFAEQNKHLSVDISRLKQQIEVVNLQSQFLQ